MTQTCMAKLYKRTPLSLIRHMKYWGEDIRDAVETLSMDDDWIGDHLRVIHESALLDILEEELGNDEYVLGCFNADFVACVTDLPAAMIEACQKADCPEAVGKAIIDGGWLRNIAEAYASADGYGHHFSHYDFSEEEIGDWHVFRVN